MGDIRKRYEEIATELREYLAKDRHPDTPVGAWFRELADLQSKFIEIQLEIAGMLLGSK
ncbi:hypothetical protein LCGC14_0717830 [marine sediment metagenome]|uniref:Uncharacterized protein n=1 Tax=marine sediment metagenome TaxID=412755 RepID=A0A0F9QHJ5_9ZZZZ